MTDSASYPPEAAVPVISPKGKPVRRWQAHQGDNVFLARGRLLSSRDNLPLFGTSCTIFIALPIAYLVFNAQWLWGRWNGAGTFIVLLFLYLVALMWTNFAVTALRDPGILPRGLDESNDGVFIKHVRLKQGLVVSKWCDTCGTFRPPRASHCRLCDNCVENTDHHCTWVNNCVGRRNYTSFVAFVSATFVCGYFLVGFSTYRVVRAYKDAVAAAGGRAVGTGDWLTSDKQVLGSLVVTCVSFFFLLPLSSLLGYHARLIWINHTTIEMLRPRTNRLGAVDQQTGEPVQNLYDTGSALGNAIYVLCRPVPPSFVAGWKPLTKDERVSAPEPEAELKQVP